MGETARALKLELQHFDVPASTALAPTFALLVGRRIEAIIVSSDTLFQAHARETAQRAATHRLPSIGAMEFAEAGGLIGYGINDAQLYRRGAYFVDRLLKGATTADLPIERATRLELVVNRRTASSMGITIPQSMLIRADQVIG